MPVRPLTLARQTAFSLLIVAAITVVCCAHLDRERHHGGFAYPAGVLAIAAAWGLVEAIVASVAAMLCFNFSFCPLSASSLSPILRTGWRCSRFSPRRWSPATFRTGKRSRPWKPKARQKETEQLYALSRIILMTDPAQSVGFQSAQHIAEIFDCPAVALYDAKSGEIFRGGAEDCPKWTPS